MNTKTVPWARLTLEVNGDEEEGENERRRYYRREDIINSVDESRERDRDRYREIQREERKMEND